MSKWEKLLSRISSLPNGMRFSELNKILESFGYTNALTKKWEQPFYIQKARKKSYYNSKSLAYKKVYVQMDKKVVEEEQNEKH